MRVVSLHVDGAARIERPTKLEDFQKIVGGHIETVGIPARPGLAEAIVVVDEEGLLKQYSPNILVELLLTKHVGPLNQRIVGNAFVCGLDRESGDFVDVPVWVEQWLVRVGFQVFDEEVRRG